MHCYFIFASENDYFAHMDFNKTGTIEKLANNVVSNINIAIKRLVKLGAKNFFVVNSSDLSLVPYEITMKRTDFAKIFVDTINETLPKTLSNLEKNLDISIVLFDHTIVSNDIVR